ncbi:hypothetical protein L3Q82_015229 [Scortum barcoo]|uniref:Uncharacterized protein n=1 Tax=Scortum barcoo TaxID=214431 RepID=A0ACB8VTJ8_9TELE|nr:hypothetical protein L3Q82_015229 [Scortum barcoo]
MEVKGAVLQRSLFFKSRKIQPSHTPLLINNTAVEVVSSTKFLGKTDDLTWSVNSASLVKRAQQRLYFLRRMKRAHLPPAHPHYVLQEYCREHPHQLHLCVVWRMHCC